MYKINLSLHKSGEDLNLALLTIMVSPGDVDIMDFPSVYSVL